MKSTQRILFITLLELLVTIRTGERLFTSLNSTMTNQIATLFYLFYFFVKSTIGMHNVQQLYY